MEKFRLEILSPQRSFYIGECVSIVLPVSDGMIGIMANHAPFTSAISDGEISFTKPDGERVTCAAMRGMVDVMNNRVRVLCESVLYPDEISEESERREAETAAMEMKKNQSRKDFILWQLSFNKAMNRLKVKKKESKNI